MVDISIIVPAFNAESHIQETIDSLKIQKNSKCEFIFVNDGSTDATPDILLKNKKDDERIKIVTIENSGVSGARNIGLDNAKGEYILFLDSDDLLAGDAIETFLDVARQTNCDIVMAKYKNFIDKDAPILTTKQLVNFELLSKIQMHKKLAKCQEIQNFIWGKLYKRSLFSSFRFNGSARIWEDVREQYKIIEQCETGALIHNELIFYRQQNESLSKKLDEKKINEFCYAQIDKAQFYLEKYPEFAHLHSESMFQCGAEVLNRGFRKQISIFKEFLVIYKKIVKKGTLNDKIKYFIIKHNLFPKSRSK